MDTKRKKSLQVVLTREERASVDMSVKLRDLGFKPIIFPTIQFARVYADYTGAQNFSDYDWLIFPTKRAVQYFFKRFRQKIDSSVKICACGAGAQEELRKNNYTEHKFSEKNSPGAIVKGFEGVPPGKVVYLYAKSSTGQIASLLSPGGFIVRELPLYTTEPPAEVDEMKLEIIKKGYYDIITFASSSAVKHLMMILKGKVGSFKGKTAIVVGAETKKLLVGSAFEKVIVGSPSNEKGLVDALVDYRKSME